MSREPVNRAVIGEVNDEIFLNNSLFFDERCCKEIMEMEKHEIVVKICDLLGASPSNLALSERILDDLKFEIARFVIHHEYCKNNSIRSQLLLWLDSKIHPAKARKLTNFIDKYLK